VGSVVGSYTRHPPALFLAEYSRAPSPSYIRRFARRFAPHRIRRGVMYGGLDPVIGSIALF